MICSALLMTQSCITKCIHIGHVTFPLCFMTYNHAHSYTLYSCIRISCIYKTYYCTLLRLLQTSQNIEHQLRYVCNQIASFPSQCSQLHQDSRPVTHQLAQGSLRVLLMLCEHKEVSEGIRKRPANTIQLLLG